MNLKSYIPESILTPLRRTKQKLRRPVIDPLRNMLGAFTVYPFSQFNNYDVSERSQSLLPNAFNGYKASPLCHIMNEKGTDKALYQGTGMHNYSPFYFAIFKEFQNKPIRIFELGLGSINPSIQSNMGASGTPGASLRAWKQFFPNARVFGADIDKSILFKEDRITTYYTDQTNPEVIKNMWLEEDLQEKFDFIIDDGLHEYEPNICFFENSIHKLKNRGLYIIEDVSFIYFDQWEKYLKSLSSSYPELRYCLIKIPNDSNGSNNNLLVLEKLS